MLPGTEQASPKQEKSQPDLANSSQIFLRVVIWKDRTAGQWAEERQEGRASPEIGDSVRLPIEVPPFLTAGEEIPKRAWGWGRHGSNRIVQPTKSRTR